MSDTKPQFALLPEGSGPATAAGGQYAPGTWYWPPPGSTWVKGPPGSSWQPPPPGTSQSDAPQGSTWTRPPAGNAPVDPAWLPGWVKGPPGTSWVKDPPGWVRDPPGSTWVPEEPPGTTWVQGPPGWLRNPPGTTWTPPQAPGSAASPTHVAAMGYRPDVPDPRDKKIERPPVSPTTHQPFVFGERPPEEDPKKAEARKKNIANMVAQLIPAEYQGSLHSCTAHAVIGIIEYLHSRRGQHRDFSRMFLYYNTRRLMREQGNVGSYIRTAMKAVAAFGVCPEEDWPYDPALLDVEPSAAVYALARNYRSISYLRLDNNGSAGEPTSARIKESLNSGFPVVIGFPVPDSICHESGVVPHHGEVQSFVGGHAVLLVKYHEKLPDGVEPKAIKKGPKGIEIDSPKLDGGYFLFRNSWGPQWGDNGFGYLPESYVTEGLAVDAWTLLAWDALDDPAFA